MEKIKSVPRHVPSEVFASCVITCAGHPTPALFLAAVFQAAPVKTATPLEHRPDHSES
jgi:hypothetical protein